MQQAMTEPKTGELHISSAVVFVRPEYLQAVCREIEWMSGCEIFTHSSEGKIVIITETSSSQQISQVLRQIEDLSGVLSAQMVYHQIESLED